ncbi:hypothetical protein C8Q70DRAFT_1059139 [Cubamyces menziesii]|nr:hypothetical protein C8Q70DRAFT_1059139 [Cubamyces menziesii]
MMVHLPVELLLFIFQLTQDGLYQHDPSIIQGPRSPWMIALRTRKALALTCKAFAGPATELLYGDIVLRRMGQIPALARTLDPAHTPSAGVFSQLVRSIRIDSCVVWAPFADVMREDLRSILERCTALTAFSYRPHPNYDRRLFLSQEEPEDAFSPEWLWGIDTGGKLTGALQPQTLRSLRSLDLQIPRCSVSLWLALESALDSASNLVKLRLYPMYIALETRSRRDLYRTVRLPALEDLQIYDRKIANSDDPSVQHHISRLWELPRLTALTISRSDSLLQDAPLIQKYGGQITYLQWGINNLSRLQLFDDAANIGTSCPRLEHLVIQGFDAHQTFAHIVCPTLRVLGLWYDQGPPATCDIKTRVGQMIRAGTPSLERVNVFVSPHRRSAKFHWPRLSSSFALSIDEHVLCKRSGLPDIHVVWTDPSDFPTRYSPTSSHLQPLNPLYHDSFSLGVFDDDPSEDEADVGWTSSNESLTDELDAADEDETESMSEWEGTDDDTTSDITEDLDLSESTLTQVHQVDRATVLSMFQDSQEGGFLLDDFDEEV